jgi:hypothetical protein
MRRLDVVQAFVGEPEGAPVHVVVSRHAGSLLMEWCAFDRSPRDDAGRGGAMPSGDGHSASRAFIESMGYGAGAASVI